MKIAKMTLLLFGLLISGYTTANERPGISSLSDVTEKGRIREFIRRNIADLDVGFGGEFLDFDLFDGLNISARYGYEVEPSFRANYYARFDKWKVKQELDLGDIMEDSSPLYFNVSRGSEIHFIRQFKSQKKALIALPYTPKRLPLKAERALKHLKPGDFVAIPARMTVAIGASTRSGSDVEARAGAQYFLHGAFNIHVFRMKDNYVRVKLIAENRKGLSAGASVEGDFEFFGVKIVDKAIRSIFELDFGEFRASRSKGSQFILDYVFNLSDAGAREAYDNILSSALKFKDGRVFREFLRRRSLEVRFLSSYEMADRLAKEDVNSEDKRVKRIFKGFNTYKRRSKKLGLGFLFGKWYKKHQYTENMISHDDANDNRRFFYYPISTVKKKTKVGTWPFKIKDTTVRSIFGLVPVDAGGRSRSVSDFGVIFDGDDRFFRGVEQKNFRSMLEDNLPSVVTDEIQWGDWNNYVTKRAAKAFLKLVIKNQAFQNIKVGEYEDFKDKVFEYYKNRHQIDKGMVRDAWGTIWDSVRVVGIKDRISLLNMSKKLYKVLSRPNMAGKDRVKALIDLRGNDMFSEFGPGFILSLVSSENIHKSMYFKFKMHAHETTVIDYKYGELDNAALYSELEYVHNSLNNRRYDLSLSLENIEERGKRIY